MAREKSYPNSPVVLVFKSSNRSNAKTKMKIFRNRNIDEVNNIDIKLPGVPEHAIILELGVGTPLINRCKKKYNI